MALEWRWENKVGTITIFNYDREVEFSLYQGNAFLIMIYEYQEDGKDMYRMHNFFADKQHAKNCLGLSKGHNENIFNQDAYQIRKIHINADKYSYTKDLVDMLLKAFDNIEIRITKGE